MAELTTRWLKPEVFSIVVSGEWDLADDLEALRACGEALNSGAPGLLVDLEACTFMDSSALRALFDINREVERRDMRLAVLGSSESVRRLFDLTGAHQALPIVYGRAAAIELASPSPAPRATDRVPVSAPSSEA